MNKGFILQYRLNILLSMKLIRNYTERNKIIADFVVNMHENVDTVKKEKLNLQSGVHVNISWFKSLKIDLSIYILCFKLISIFP